MGDCKVIGLVGIDVLVLGIYGQPDVEASGMLAAVGVVLVELSLPRTEAL